MNSRLLSFFLALCFSGMLSAQQAPDFSVTDINGSSHTLYTDYLDQGKVVILGFFYDGAPMIESLYPMLQDYAYAEWEQNLPLGVLLLSAIDSHNTLSVFAESHSLSLPVSGTDGGAHTAIDAYINGAFGPFFGYPMFVVVGPTGEVVYDPWGTNNEDIIATLDAAVKTLLSGGVSVGEHGHARPSVTALPHGIRVETPPGQGVEAFNFHMHDLNGRLLEVLRLPAGYSGIHPWPSAHSRMVICSFEYDGVRISEKLLR